MSAKKASKGKDMNEAKIAMEWKHDLLEDAKKKETPKETEVS
jgi:hypothetical protein